MTEPSPPDDFPLGTNTMSIKGIFAGLIPCFVIANILTPIAFSELPESAVFAGILLGIVAGQVNLISVWGALAPGPVVVRLPWSLLLVACLFLSLAAGLAADHERGFAGIPADEVPTLGAVLLAGQLIAQFPLWIGGQIFGWRLVLNPETTEKESDRSRAGQFSIRHLLLGTTLLAAVLGIGKAILPAEAFRLSAFALDSELWVLLISLVICNLLVAVPCVWIAFQPNHRLGKLSAAWALVVTGATICQFAALCAILGSPHGGLAVILFAGFLLMNWSQCITVGGSLWIFRQGGFRLLRKADRNVAANERISAGEKPSSPWD